MSNPEEYEFVHHETVGGESPLVEVVDLTNTEDEIVNPRTIDLALPTQICRITKSISNYLETKQRRINDAIKTTNRYNDILKELKDKGDAVAKARSEYLPVYKKSKKILKAYTRSKCVNPKDLQNIQDALRKIDPAWAQTEQERQQRGEASRQPNNEAQTS